MRQFLRDLRKWLRGRTGVSTVTIYLKGGNEISFDATDWEWKYEGNELKSYNFTFAPGENHLMRYLRIADVQAITVSRD